MALRDWLARRAGPAIEAALASRPARATALHLFGALRERRLEALFELLEVALHIASPEEKHAFYQRMSAYDRADNKSLRYAIELARWTRERIATERGSLTGLRVLELGPGYSLAHGLLLHAYGVERYAAVDLFPIAISQTRFYADLRAELERPPLLFPGPEEAERVAEVLQRFDAAVDLTGLEARFPTPERVGLWSPVDAGALPFEDASFDVVLSVAAFEHFAEPERAIAESARVLAPGGVGIHQIDMRDHRPGSQPLDFLREPAESWHQTWEGEFNFTNRRRAPWFEQAFRASGFAAVDLENVIRTEVTTTDRERFDAEFRDMSLDALAITSALFVTRRAT